MRTNQLLFGLAVAATLFSFAAGAADDLEALAGKWSVKKVNDQGQDYTQTIAVKKDKFVFQILGAEDRLVHVRRAVDHVGLRPEQRVEARGSGARQRVHPGR